MRPHVAIACAATMPAVVVPLVALGLALSSNPGCGTSRADQVAWTLGWVGAALVGVAALVDLVLLVVARGARLRIALFFVLAAASIFTVSFALAESFDFCMDFSF